MSRYSCPMHPDYVSDTPGSCSICGMKLALDTKHSAPAGAADSNPAAEQPPPGRDQAAPGRTVAGRATISVSPEARRLLGIRGEVVREMKLVRQIRSVGRVVPDERRLWRVYAKCAGFVEQVHAHLLGKRLRKGEPLLSLGCSGLAAPVQVRAPGSGNIVLKKAAAGMRVRPGDLLYEIADLSRVWVLADLYEADLPSVQVGMEAGLTVLSLPGKSWRAQVTDVSSSVDGKARTIALRIDVENAGGELRPNMLVDVFLRRDLGSGLMVPDTAVILAGNRRLAFVDHEDGRLEPRELRLGPNVGSGFQVLSGLAEGERVVTSANFLIDSEASLKGALASPLDGSAAVSGNQR
jgi:Cu(I)/Ag(I) efflux system membrane fusion protein